MDPLAERLACECALPSSLRKYDKLGDFLEERLDRAVRITYGEDLGEALARAGGGADLIIGKQSVVLRQAAENKTSVWPIAMLTDMAGSTELKGLFVVRSDDPARDVSDLRGHRILFGPKAPAEKHAAAVEKLKVSGVSVSEPIRTSPRCTTAALAVFEKEADAAVISSYALACLGGGKFVPTGALRVVGETNPVPFITVFAAPGLSPDEEPAGTAALTAVRTRPALLSAMRSRDGFVKAAPRGL